MVGKCFAILGKMYESSQHWKKPTDQYFLIQQRVCRRSVREKTAKISVDAKADCWRRAAWISLWPIIYFIWCKTKKFTKIWFENESFVESVGSRFPSSPPFPSWLRPGDDREDVWRFVLNYHTERIDLHWSAMSNLPMWSELRRNRIVFRKTKRFTRRSIHSRQHVSRCKLHRSADGSEE